MHQKDLLEIFSQLNKNNQASLLQFARFILVEQTLKEIEEEDSEETNPVNSGNVIYLDKSVR